MAERGDPEVLRRVVRFVRFHLGLSQTKFGEAFGLDQNAVSEAELGARALSEVEQRRMAAAYDLPWPLMVHLRRFVEAFLATLARWRTAWAGEGTASLEPAVAEPVLLAVTPYLAATAGAGRPNPEEVLEQAERAWAALRPRPLPEQQRLLALAARTARGWGLAVVACEASLKAASDRAAEAKTLAELALFVAERVRGPQGWCARLRAYCLAYLANSVRVANDFDEADATFARAWALWRAGDGSGPLELPEWRLLSLEASLRRAQHRFGEALRLLNLALAHDSGTDEVAAARLLLQKSHILERQQDAEGALAALAQAAPAIERSGDLHLRFSLKFDVAANLAHLHRYPEAAALLPEVNALCGQLGRQLHAWRVLWLEARVDAGLGRKEEAAAKLERVLAAFTELAHPYDAALAGLELSAL